MDYQRPRKKGLVNTGYHHTDWERDSIVINSAWLEGECPMIGWEGTVKEVMGMEILDKRPARGIRQTVEILLGEKVIELTEEIQELLDGSIGYYLAHKFGKLDSADNRKKEWR